MNQMSLLCQISIDNRKINPKEDTYYYTKDKKDINPGREIIHETNLEVKKENEIATEKN